MEKANVDTDAIIPKQFLKTIKRTGLGSALFHPLRYKEDGSENPDFILNQEPDIFFCNTFKNGMLPLIMEDEEALQKITAEAKASREIEVDLVNQVVKDAQGNKLAEFE